MGSSTRTLLYNPGLLSPEDLRSGFLVRQHDLSILKEHLFTFANGQGRQHLFVNGRRGMGKTTLLCRAALLCREEPELSGLIPVQLGEEHPQVGDLADLWMEVVRGLDNELNRPELGEEAEKILFSGGDAEHLAEKLLSLIGRVSEEEKKSIVLLIDGMDEIFEGISDIREQHRLREELQSNESFLLIAASSRFAEAIYDYDAPFYDFFKVHTLEPLNRKEIRSLLDGLAKNAGDKKIPQMLDKRPDRLEGIYRLTGGEPRMVLLAYRMIQESPLGSVREDLEDMLDEVTPYYKHLIEEIPRQRRRIFESLARHWSPATAQDLEVELRAERSVIAAQLSRLHKEGWIEPVGLPGRATAYQVTSRLLNLFVLMRFSRDARRKLRLWAAFVEAFFGLKHAYHAVNPYMDRLQGQNEDPAHRKELLREAVDTICCLQDASAKERAIGNMFDVGTHEEIEEILSSLPSVDANTLRKTTTVRYRKLAAKLKKAKIKFPKWDHKAFTRMLLGSADFSLEEKERIAESLDSIEQEELEKVQKKLADEFDYRKERLGNRIWKQWQKLISSGNLGTSNELASYCNYLVNYIDSEEGLRGYEFLLGYLLAEASDCQKILKSLAIQLGENGNVLVNRLIKIWKAALYDEEKGSSIWASIGYFLHYELGNANDAKEFYDRSLELNPQSAVTWYNLGNLYKDNLCEFLKAEEAYRKAIEMDPKYSYPWNSLGNLLMENCHRFLEAEKAYRKAIELDSKDAYPWNGLGNLLSEQLHRYEEAEEAYRKAIELDPKYVHPWNGLGNLLKEQLHRYEEAEEAYRKAIELDPKYVHPWNGLGNLLKEQPHRTKEAEEAYLKAIELDPKYVHPWYNLGLLYYYDLKRFEEAEEFYKKALELDSKYAPAWNCLGNFSREKLNNFQKAEDLYLKAIELDPKYALPWNNIGLLYHYDLERFEEAEKSYKKALELDPEYANAWNSLGNLFKDKLGRYKEAEEAYRKAIALDPKKAFVWHNLGLLYHFDLVSIKKAEECYREALELDPQYASCWDSIGNLYKDKLNKFVEAEKAYLKAIELDPKYAYPWNGLGNLYKDKLNKYKEAEKAYLKAIEIQPDFTYPWHNLGLLYQYNLERYEDAEHAYRKAIDLDSKDDSSWYRLGILMKRLKKYSEAEEAYQRALSIERDAYTLNNLAWLIFQHMERDRLEEALALVKEACEVDPEYTHARHTYAAILVALERWDDAYKATKEYLQQADVDHLADCGKDGIDLVCAYVHAGKAKEILELLGEALEPDWWAPVKAALVVFVEDQPEHFKTLPKEIADLGKEILLRFQKKEEDD